MSHPAAGLGSSLGTIPCLWEPQGLLSCSAWCRAWHRSLSSSGAGTSPCLWECTCLVQAQPWAWEVAGQQTPVGLGLGHHLVIASRLDTESKQHNKWHLLSRKTSAVKNRGFPCSLCTSRALGAALWGSKAGAWRVFSCLKRVYSGKSHYRMSITCKVMCVCTVGAGHHPFSSTAQCQTLACTNLFMVVLVWHGASADAKRRGWNIEDPEECHCPVQEWRCTQPMSANQKKSFFLCTGIFLS